MDDLVAWWRVQLDDIERVATAAADYGPTWRADGGDIYPSDESRHPGALIVGPYGCLEEQYAAHITLWDPKRALAYVDAMRRILDRYEDALHRQGEWEESQMSAAICAQEYEDWVLPALALPLADQPGYRDEWRP